MGVDALIVVTSYVSKWYIFNRSNRSLITNTAGYNIRDGVNAILNSEMEFVVFRIEMIGNSSGRYQVGRALQTNSKGLQGGLLTPIGIVGIMLLAFHRSVE